MRKTEGFSRLSENVFLAVVRLGDKAYAASVRREYEQRTGRDISMSAVFATLDRLESNGYLSSLERDGVNVNDQKPGPNPRRYYTVEEKGKEAFNRIQVETARLMDGLQGLVPAGLNGFVLP